MIKHKSQFISNILSPAIRLWLRSQLTSVDNIKLDIQAGDKDILKGRIDRVYLLAEKATYRGIRFHKASVKAESIAFNLREILLRKPFRLLHPFFIEGEILLLTADLQQGLNSPLLSRGLEELVYLLAEKILPPSFNSSLFFPPIHWKHLKIFPDKFLLTGITGNKSYLSLTAGVRLKNPNTLLFTPLEISGIASTSPLIVEDFEIFLGEDVFIQSLHLNPQHIVCHGKVKVFI
ncbi:MAG: DUF2993 domain-containing protein [Geminocystis sp.]|nr:DUF2993 domain-containing protein [Geminocystis sp.]HIK36703.1 DUF2993 domain-containing protein [Geminocystis sp. M7585_C2015_104]MCS7146782.1 DUF2993 domain-containing protein [Geminocystis sp.]MCX8077068.1 DUF2993 domain-containing protein [Geminocystis sp.]MDW8115608.1 DUF2993 domain-containing protein [Geminocystis sp.]